jgi:hypothetical protein
MFPDQPGLLLEKASVLRTEPQSPIQKGKAFTVADDKESSCDLCILRGEPSACRTDDGLTPTQTRPVFSPLSGPQASDSYAGRGVWPFIIAPDIMLSSDQTYAPRQNPEESTHILLLSNPLGHIMCDLEKVVRYFGFAHESVFLPLIRFGKQLQIARPKKTQE